VRLTQLGLTMVDHGLIQRPILVYVVPWYAEEIKQNPLPFRPLRPIII